MRHPGNHRLGPCLHLRHRLLFDRLVPRDNRRVHLRRLLLPVEEQAQVLDPLGPPQQPRIILSIERQQRRGRILPRRPHNNRIRNLRTLLHRRLVQDPVIAHVGGRSPPTRHKLLTTRRRHVRRHVMNTIRHTQRLQKRKRHRLRDGQGRERHLEEGRALGHRARIRHVRPTLVQHVRNIRHLIHHDLVRIVVRHCKLLRILRARLKPLRRRVSHKLGRKVLPRRCRAQTRQPQALRDAVIVQRTQILALHRFPRRQRNGHARRGQGQQPGNSEIQHDARVYIRASERESERERERERERQTAHRRSRSSFNNRYWWPGLNLCQVRPSPRKGLSLTV